MNIGDALLPIYLPSPLCASSLLQVPKILEQENNTYRTLVKLLQCLQVFKINFSWAHK